MTKKQLGRVHWGFGLFLLLAWPWALFVSFFFFDAPNPAPTLMHAAWSIWSYPVLFFVGLVSSKILFRRDPESGLVRLAAYLPAVSIAWFLGACVVGL